MKAAEILKDRRPPSGVFFRRTPITASAGDSQIWDAWLGHPQKAARGASVLQRVLLLAYHLAKTASAVQQ